MALSYYLANKLLDHAFRNVAYTPPANVYLCLFTTMPGPDGTGGVEVAGGGYTRELLAYAAAVTGQLVSSGPITFSTMPGATVVGAGAFDALVAGNLLKLGPFTTPAVVAAGTDFVVPAADVITVLR